MAVLAVFNKAINAINRTPAEVRIIYVTNTVERVTHEKPIYVHPDPIQPIPMPYYFDNRPLFVTTNNVMPLNSK